MTNPQKTALVTGASRGIGRAIATRLAAEGHLVAVHYGFDKQAADQTVNAITTAGGEAFPVHAELGIPNDAETLLHAFDAGLATHGTHPGLDVLVNNAGTNGPGPIEGEKSDQYDKVFAVNVHAPYAITRLALPRLRDGGRIINISSGVSKLAYPQDPAYAMTKGALDQLTRALAKQLGPRSITVNSVGPGIIDTDINAPWLRDNPTAQATAAAYSALGRIGEPSDVADIVAFLASDAARWISGSWLDATGGSILAV